MVYLPKKMEIEWPKAADSLLYLNKENDLIESELG